MTAGRVVAAIALVGFLAGCSDRERPTIADGQLMAMPDALDFARVAMFSTTQRSIALRNVGRGRLAVEEMWLEDVEGNTYEAAFNHPGPHSMITGGECDLDATFAPIAPGTHLANLVIRSDSRVNTFTRIALTGEGVDARALLSDQSLDYGRIEAQSTEDKTLTLTNSSDLPIRVWIKPIGNDADEFNVPAQFAMAGSETRKITVTFAPQRVGVKSATLQVTPCDGCTPQTVTLLAEALDRAVVAEPALIDYGQVPVDRENDVPYVLHNLATVPMTVTGMRFVPPIDASFAYTAQTFPITLAPNEVRQFPSAFHPTHEGLASGGVSFAVNSVRNPTTGLTLQGYGGSAELCISPLAYDYGLQPVGAKTIAWITIRNCGSANAAPLVMKGIAILNDGSANSNEFNLGPFTAPTTLTAGQQMVVKAFFEPTVEGAAMATVQVRTTAFNANQVNIKLSGTAKQYPPCKLKLTPAAIDFGTVAPGTGAVLGIKVTNIGPDVCPVKDIHLRDSANGIFGMPGGALDGVVLWPGDHFSFMVSFVPPSTATGEYTGSVEITEQNAGAPVLLVPLMGNASPSCLVAEPPYLDFGVDEQNCTQPAKQTALLNRCSQPITITNIAIGPGTTDGQFVFTQQPGTPLTLNGGETVTVGVDYLATDPGMNLSPLYVSTSELAHPYLVPLVGEASWKVDQTDTFYATAKDALDILFVVDNSVSMVEEHPRLYAAIPSFVSALQAQGIDAHVAVTTSGLTAVSNACPGGALGGENGRFFPVDASSPRMLLGSAPNLTAELQNNVKVGECQQDQPVLEAMRRALSEPLIDETKVPGTQWPSDGNAGFLRQGAALAVIGVSDDEDTSPDAVATYVSFLQTLKGANQPQRATFFAIAPTQATCGTQGGTGTRLGQAAAMTGGDILSDCASDYSPLLDEVARKSVSPQDHFPLTKKPDPTTITVKVNGASFTSWSYDASTNNVIFSTPPSAGATVQITYRVSC